jgi:hypothetical protein
MQPELLEADPGRLPHRVGRVAAPVFRLRDRVAEVGVLEDAADDAFRFTSPTRASPAKIPNA